jgi:hypothetical protein
MDEDEMKLQILQAANKKTLNESIAPVQASGSSVQTIRLWVVEIEVPVGHR